MSSLDERIDRLSGTGIFASLSRRRIKKLARLGVERTFAPGDLILEQGATGLGMFVILHGSVEIVRGRGEEERTLATLGDGDLLGEMALIDDLPRSASARAVETTECLLITRAGFRDLTRRDPEIAWCVVPTLSARLRQALEDNRSDRAEEHDSAAAPSPSVVPEPRSARPGRQWGLGLARAQHAALVAGAQGIRGAAELGERFLNDLARYSELHETDRLQTAVTRLPAGFAVAGRRTLVQALKLPGRVLEAVQDALDPE